MCSCFVYKRKPPSWAAVVAKHIFVVLFKISMTITNVRGATNLVYDIYHTRAYSAMIFYIFAKFQSLL